MTEIPFHYLPVPTTTWVYLSSLLAIALYFKFSRLWSVRNLDLILLILMAPGLLLVEYGRGPGSAAPRAADVEYMGYIWLFVTSGLFLVRLLTDPLMVRRPLLEPNLSVGGQTFLGASLLLFLMANVLTSRVTDEDLAGPKLANQLRNRQAVPAEQNTLATHGPGYPFLFLLPSISTQTIFGDSKEKEPGEAHEVRKDENEATARTVAILCHLAIVIGIVMIGYRHFDNIKTGIAAATLYLLLPYTAQMTGRVHHVLPAALLIWAVERYRRPLVSGMLMGLAIGVIYFPAFLLPLWIAFYWQRGLLRFLIGVASTILVLVGTLAFTSDSQEMFLAQMAQMFGWRAPVMDLDKLGGFWHYSVPFYRLPVLAAFGALCGSFAIWPAQKNLGTLMSCSAAVMLGVQFWHPQGGGIYMAWYLPLLLLTIFRPNLEDRVALSVLGEGWFPQRLARLRQINRAA